MMELVIFPRLPEGEFVYVVKSGKDRVGETAL